MNATVCQIVEYVSSSYPIIYLYTSEEYKATRIIKHVAADVDAETIYRYDLSEGLQCILGIDKRLKYDKRNNIHEAVGFFAKAVDKKAFAIFCDIHGILNQDSKLIRLFKNIANEILHNNLPITIFIISSCLQIPSELEKNIVVVDIPLPTRDEIGQSLDIFLNRYGITLDDSLKGRFIEALSGLNETEISNIMNLCIQDGEITEEDLSLIISQKQQSIKKGGILDFVNVGEKIESIGGLKNLKAWLKGKKIVFDKLEKAREFGVDTPKGILLFGMPGCGKSLAAKAIATYFDLPLLRLDIGMILGPYVGQSEENFRKAIKIAESIAPAVLWIDELEKAFVGIGQGSRGGSSEVTTRIFGTILTWMQEKTKPVFVVATSNSIAGMPPEFMRKGRFDEIFFVDFPQDKEIEEIIKVHLRKRKKDAWIDQLDFPRLVAKIDEFSGADIEAVVKELVEDIFISREGNYVSDSEIDNDISFNLKNTADTDAFIAKIKEFKPLSVTMKGEIKNLRETVENIDSKKAN
jgi:SpoVK/Ycf46/Vps4 family AAA+-type ATPase